MNNENFTYEDYCLEEPGLTGLIDMMADRNLDAYVSRINGVRTVVVPIDIKVPQHNKEPKIVHLTAFCTDARDDYTHINIYVPGRPTGPEHLKTLTPAKALSTIFQYTHTLED